MTSIKIPHAVPENQLFSSRWLSRSQPLRNMQYASQTWVFDRERSPVSRVILDYKRTASLLYIET